MQLLRMLSVSVGIVAAALATGCESLPQARNQPPVPPEEARLAFDTAEAAYGALGYRRDWMGFPVIAGGDSARFLVAAGDLVLVQDGRSTVSALEASDGSRRWTNTLANSLTNFVGMDRIGDRVLCVSEAEIFQVDATTGSLVSRRTLPELGETAPVLSGGQVIYGTGTGRVVSHLFVTGVTAWRHAMEGAIRVRPVLLDTAVGLVSEAGHVMFLDAATGSLIGRGDPMYDAPGADPAAGDGLLYVAGRDQSLYAFSPVRSRPIWRRRTDTELTSAPVYDAGVVYCDVATTGLSAFRSQTGDPMWSAQTVHGQVVGTRRGRLIVWDGSTAVTLDPATGTVYDRVTLPGVSRLALDAFHDGNLYVVSDHGVVVKFRPR